MSGADLAGSSVGASLALEVAALWPASVRRIAAIAPFGLFDEKNPPTDPWAQRADQVPGLMCADPEIWKAMKATPEGANSIEWPIEQTRAAEAAARIFWPLGNTRIEKRLRLIQAPVLLLWGENDRIMPRAYAETFARGIAGKTDNENHSGRGPSGRTRQTRRGRQSDPRFHRIGRGSMAIDPDTQAVLDMIRLAGRPPFETLTPDEARQAYAASRKMLATAA